MLIPLPEERRSKKRFETVRILAALLRYLSYALVSFTSILAIATIGSSIVRVAPPYTAVVLPFLVIAGAVTYLYLSRRRERSQALEQLPADEKSLFAEVGEIARQLIEEDSV